ncbi:hypothetical protein EDD15DRAFT_2274463 [Pisolithus albus]|nr:hypothetical protein EDD15DRAFT_2274463 [Pisolithus albus]
MLSGRLSFSSKAIPPFLAVRCAKSTVFPCVDILPIASDRAYLSTTLRRMLYSHTSSFKRETENLVSYSCSIKIITAVRHRSKIRYQASQTARPSNHIPQPSSQTTTGILTCPTAAPPLVLIFHSLKSPNVPGSSTLTAGTSIFPDRLSRR